MPKIADAAVAKARLRVVPRRTTRPPRVPFVMLVSLLLVGGVVGLLVFNTSMQQTSFTAAELEQRAEVLSAREQGLAMELENLRDPQRLNERAQAIGMVLPGTTGFVLLQTNDVVSPQQAPPAALPRLHELPPIKPLALDPDPVIIQAADEHSDDTASSSPDAGRQRGKNGHQNRHHHPKRGR
jgi:cell division protein FtsB